MFFEMNLNFSLLLSSAPAELSSITQQVFV